MKMSYYLVILCLRFAGWYSFPTCYIWQRVIRAVAQMVAEGEENKSFFPSPWSSHRSRRPARDDIDDQCQFAPTVFTLHVINLEDG